MIILSVVLIGLVLAAVLFAFYAPTLMGVIFQNEEDPYEEPVEEVAPEEHHQDKVATEEGATVHH